MGYAEQKLQFRSQTLADEGEAILVSLDGTTELARVAVVQRGIPQPLAETPGVLRRQITVMLANDATLGVLASAIIRGQFYVKMALRQGGTAEILRSIEVVSQDEAWIVLEAQ